MSSELDLARCALEPIHVPGTIQPHGAVIAAPADGRLVTHASTNLATILGRSVQAVLGLPIEEVLGETVCQMLMRTQPCAVVTLGRACALLGPNGDRFHLSAHRSDHRICVDIEPVRPEAGHEMPLIMLQSVLDTFQYAVGQSELCELAVKGLSRITGYDRVMAYRFSEEGHGEVVAEARAAQLEPYLGLRYPASDIPPQARRQYLRQRVGAIADSNYRAVPLLTDPVHDDGTPLDLTHSALRSVSPIHREYMRNMKTAASLTIGLGHGGDLWGMLVCHHGTVRIASPELRASADTIGRVVSLMLGSLGNAEIHARMLKREATLRALVDRLALPLPLPDAFAAAATELLALVDATGVVVRFSGTVLRLGQTPPPHITARALAVLKAEAGEDVLAVDDLGLRHPEFACCTNEGSGALILPLSQDTDNAILWFRPELQRTVVWGGNPAEHAKLDPVTLRISPRASFDAWKQSVSGRSAPWTEVDRAVARELRIAVATAVAKHTRTALVQLRIQHQQDLRAQNSRFKATLDHMSQGLMMVDADGNIAVINRQAIELLGLPHDFFQTHRTHADVMACLWERGEFGKDGETLAPKVRGFIKAGALNDIGIYERTRPDGTVLEVYSVPLPEGGLVRTFTDISARKHSEVRIVHMAHHDELTGLPNRVLFRERIEQATARSLRAGGQFAILLLDLDRFKEVNDTLGHPAGDKLLKIVAQRLCKVVREIDTVARLGGDEFAIIQSSVLSRDDAKQLAGRVIDEINMPYSIDSRVVEIGTSIGIAVAPQDGDNADHLLQKADIALYGVKSDRRGGWSFFEAEVEARMQARSTLESDLRNAIKRGEFELHYQPMIDLSSNEVTGVEALLRWHHPTRGLIAPREFIPVAEEVGLISEIGEWVARKACADACNWPASLKLAINLSPAQLRDGKLSETIKGILAESGVPPGRLELEITETVILQGSDSNLSSLRELHDMGIGISLDDFGTGYSSLSNLRMLPITRIKIDRSFVQGLPSDESCLAIVRAVADLGKSLHVPTIAEGVETFGQLELVRAAGCKAAQGYYFSRAIPARDILDVIARFKSVTEHVA